MDLRVGRWTQRARVSADADAWRRRLDELARGPMGRALAELPDPGGVWFVPRLALRIRVPPGADDGALLAAWREGVRRALEARAAEAVGFPDRATAELEALAAGLEGEPPWWAERARRGRTAAAILAGWLESEPARVPEAVARLADGQPARLARLVSAADAAALTASLERVWAGGAPEPLPGGAPDGRVAPAHLALLLAAEARRAPATRRGSEPAPAPDRALPAARAGAPVGAEGEAGGGGAAEVAPPGPPREGRRPVPDPSAEARGPDGRPEAGRSAPPAEAGGPAPPAEAGPPRGAPRPPPAAAARAPGRWPLGLGGLFLLLRPLARHPWLADRAWRAWPEALAAVAEVALDRVLDGLAAEERARVEEAHAELLGAFAPGWPLAPADEPTRAGAAAVLDGLLADLDGDLRPVPVPAAWVQRARPTDPRLAAVLLRPARLALSPTHADLFLPLDAVDVPLRRAGWDLDPGWLPGLRRVVRLHYEDR